MCHSINAQSPRILDSRSAAERESVQFSLWQEHEAKWYQIDHLIGRFRSALLFFSVRLLFCYQEQYWWLRETLCGTFVIPLVYIWLTFVTLVLHNPIQEVLKESIADNAPFMKSFCCKHSGICGDWCWYRRVTYAFRIADMCMRQPRSFYSYVSFSQLLPWSKAIWGSAS